VLSTTRRVLGILGVTGSLLASLQFPGMISSPPKPPEVVSISARFNLAKDRNFGALSGDQTPVPVITSFERFTLPPPPSAVFASLAGIANPHKLPSFCNDRQIEVIQEETTTPHPLEILEADPATVSTTDAASFGFSSITLDAKSTLAKVAAAENLSLPVLERLNNCTVTTPLEKGRVVNLYRGSCREHRVMRGNSIWSISRRYRTSMAVLIYLNGLRSTKILPGVKLFVPKGTLAEQDQKRVKKVDWVRRLVEPPYGRLLARYGRLTSGFGWRKHPVTKKRGFHVGIDISSPKGTAIKAWRDGVIERAGTIGLLGRCVIIRHTGGFRTVYGHCSSLSVKAGDKIKKGQTIARVGKTGRATGCHLHFAIKSDRHFVNPLKYLGS